MSKQRSFGLSPKDKKVLISFGKSVKTIRTKRGLSVYDVTGDDMLIKSRQHWQAIESGQKNVNLTTAIKVARSLGVSVLDLLKGIA